MPDKPAISVVMPVYNDEKYIAEAIESILCQTFSDFELIIVNDGSTDGSTKIIEDYAAKDTRIKVIRNPQPTGRGAARNAGIAVAAADLIAFQDSDDMSIPERLEKHYKFMKDNPDKGAVFSNYILVDEDGREVAVDRIVDKNESLNGSLRNQAVHHWAAMFRTSVIREIGGYREGFSQAQDRDMILRLIERTFTGYLDTNVYKHRKTRSSITISRKREGFISGALALKFAQQRATTGHDEYDEYLKKGLIPQTKGESGSVTPSEYQFILAWKALRCWSYRACLRCSLKGFLLNPLKLHKLVIMCGGVLLHVILRTLGLLRWFESALINARSAAAFKKSNISFSSKAKG